VQPVVQQVEAPLPAIDESELTGQQQFAFGQSSGDGYSDPDPAYYQDSGDDLVPILLISISA
jgi:hypothetical protein